mmetsp:Transcript_68258/g.152369  ORF Transcript_68258/g.152369 Transcript_68258/m.152369 type:complete len:246 (+) Transcript_68258:540-1277(+)
MSRDSNTTCACGLRGCWRALPSASDSRRFLPLRLLCLSVVPVRVAITSLVLLPSSWSTARGGLLSGGRLHHRCARHEPLRRPLLLLLPTIPGGGGPRGWIKPLGGVGGWPTVLRGVPAVPRRCSWGEAAVALWRVASKAAGRWIATVARRWSAVPTKPRRGTKPRRWIAGHRWRAGRSLQAAARWPIFHHLVHHVDSGLHICRRPSDGDLARLPLGHLLVDLDPGRGLVLKLVDRLAPAADHATD